MRADEKFAVGTNYNWHTAKSETQHYTTLSQWRLLKDILAEKTSTAKQVLGNCQRLVFASFVGNFILVVNLYNVVLVYCCQALSDSGC